MPNQSLEQPVTLLPCPFCGGTDAVEERDMDGGSYVQCQTDGCEAYAHKQIWQGRTTLPSDEQEVERFARLRADIEGALIINPKRIRAFVRIDDVRAALSAILSIQENK